MKRSLLGCCCILSLLIHQSDSLAQQRGNVAVQLPTFHQFGISTTVVVPDRGRAYLGGVNRSSLGSRQFGAPVPGLGNRGINRSSSAGGVSIGATIIDHDEIDRALLAEAARRRGDRFDIHGRPVANAPRVPRDLVGQRWAPAERSGVSQSRPTQYARATSATAEAQRAQTYLWRALQAEADRQPQLAKVFYQRVAKHGSASLKQRAEAALARINATQQSARKLVHRK